MSQNINLKERRISLGYTQAYVAKLVGVSESTISRWESGNIANMKRSYIVAYANALRLSPADIVGAKDTEESEVSESSLVHDDPELAELLTRARDDPNIRMLFSVTKDASADDVKKAIQIIQMLKDK